jgi:hypothetical protein
MVKLEAMKYLISFSLLAILFCCNKNKEEPLSIQFDTIEHYQFNSRYFHSTNMDEILAGDKPTKISDFESINFVESKFRKKVIDQKTEAEIINSFSLYPINVDQEQPITSCEPVYRDLLIFRKQNKITGIIQICFDCSENKTLGTTYNSAKFFVGADYSKLFKLLSQWPAANTAY